MGSLQIFILFHNISYLNLGRFCWSWIIEQASWHCQNKLQRACWWDQETLGRIIPWKQIFRKNYEGWKGKGQGTCHKNVNVVYHFWCIMLLRWIKTWSSICDSHCLWITLFHYSTKLIRLSLWVRILLKTSS